MSTYAKSAGELEGVTWQKAKRSHGNGNCIELGGLQDGSVAVRNSRNPGGPALIFTDDEIRAFILGARDGDFDHLIA